MSVAEYDCGQGEMLEGAISNGQMKCCGPGQLDRSDPLHQLTALRFSGGSFQRSGGDAVTRGERGPNQAKQPGVLLRVGLKFTCLACPECKGPVAVVVCYLG